MLSPTNYVDKCFHTFQEYVTGVTAGTILTGRYERLAVTRCCSLREKYAPYFQENEVRKLFKFLSLINLPIGTEVKQFELQGHEAFWLYHIYGMYKDASNRLYDQSYISIAKGNNKSTIASILSVFESVRGTMNSHVLMVARSREQSRTLIEYTDKLLKCSPALANEFKINKNVIYKTTPTGRNRIEIRASDSSAVHGVGAGMSLSVIDEFAVHKDGKLQQTIKSAQESKCPNHHQLIITHASPDKFKSPAFNLQETCQNILEGKVTADNIFTQIFTIDDPSEIDDEKCWRKSNPSLGVCVPLENLKTAYETSKLFRDKKQSFLTWNLNVWSDNIVDSWIEDQVVKDLMNDLNVIPDHSEVYVGLDLSANSDICSIGILWHNRETDTFIGKVISILPSVDKVKIRKGSLDLSQWIKSDEDLLSTGPGIGYIIQNQLKALDDNLVIKIIEAINTRYRIISIGADPWNAALLLEKVERELGIQTERVRQKIEVLSYPTRVFETLVLHGRFKFETNPVLRWMINNVQIYIDPSGNKKIDKRHSEAVDGVIALVIATSEYLRLNESSTSYFLEGMKNVYKDKKESA